MLARYTGYVMPWLLLGLVPGSVWAGLMRFPWLSVFLGSSGVIIIVTYAPLFWPLPDPSSSVTSGIRILSYNVWSQNNQIEQAVKVIQKNRPDLLLLQEIHQANFHKLLKGLHGLYDGNKVHFKYEPETMLAVIGRYPFERDDSFMAKGRVQKVFLFSETGRFAVYNVHFLRRGGWHSRYRKIVTLLEEDVSGETGGVILGGDFNTNDQSETFKYIKKFLHNSHWEAGFGFGFSYPSSSKKLFGLVSPPSLVRIDHIFFNDHFVLISASTIKESGGSDHYPVMSVLGFKYDQSQEPKKGFANYEKTPRQDY